VHVGVGHEAHIYSNKLKFAIEVRNMYTNVRMSTLHLHLSDLHLN